MKTKDLLFHGGLGTRDLNGRCAGLDILVAGEKMKSHVRGCCARTKIFFRNENIVVVGR